MNTLPKSIISTDKIWAISEGMVPSKALLPDNNYQIKRLDD